jgi:hypothetical protein
MAHSHDWVQVAYDENVNPRTGRANPYVIEQCSVCGEMRQRGL